MPRLASLLLAGALSVSVVLTLGRYVFPDEADEGVVTAGDDASTDPVAGTGDVEE